MAYFEFPQTRTYEGDLGYIIKKISEISKETAYLMEEFSKIVVVTEDHIEQMIEEAIAANNKVLATQLQDLKTEITNEYNGYVTAQINTLTVYIDNQDIHYNQLAQGYASTAEANSKDYTDSQVLNYTMMINPITGNYNDVRDVVDDIVSYFHTTDSLTAGEYDTLELTALDYDNYEITAYDYDFNGKTILMP